MQKAMLLKCALKQHSPQAIYQFLEINVGQLYMVIKKGHAIINFKDDANFTIALAQYRHSCFNGFPLQLSVYTEDQFDQQPQINGRSHQINTFDTFFSTINIEFKDSGSKVEKIVNRHRRSMIDFIKNYNILMLSAKQKLRQLQNQKKDKQDVNCEKFAEFLNKRLKSCSNTIINHLKLINSDAKRFGSKQKQIDVNQHFEIKDIPSGKIQTSKFECSMLYINNQQKSSIKRIVSLNQQQFVCTYHTVSQWNQKSQKIKIYNKNDEPVIYNLKINQGAYGLLMMGEHILIGTTTGAIAYFNGNSVTQEDKQISVKLHDNTIFDIIKLHVFEENRHLIATLGMDWIVKLWCVEKEMITEDLCTLRFTQKGKIQIPFETPTIQALSDQLIALGSHQNIFIYNVSGKIRRTTEWRTRGKIVKIKRLGETTIAAANAKYVSVVDYRMSKYCQHFTFDNEIRNMCALNERSVFYGDDKGVVGVMDMRMRQPLWSCSDRHQTKIYDICKFDNLIVSGDQEGIIAGWRAFC